LTTDTIDTARMKIRYCSPRAIGISVAIFLSCTLCDAQNYPKILASKWDIRWAKASTERIRIPALPIEYYPLLAKFKQLNDVDWYWEGANDAKLREFSKLGFTNLQQVSLLDCPLVTDEGIRALANIPSIRGLGLEGTSITDAGLELMAAQMKLTGVNASNCTNVTHTGVQTLALSPSLKELTFSADDWTEEHVIELIDSFKNVKWCEITDPQRRLNVSRLKARGATKGITIVVSPIGALQTGRDYRSKHPKDFPSIRR
jgi:hypothetical protein